MVKKILAVLLVAMLLAPAAFAATQYGVITTPTKDGMVNIRSAAGVTKSVIGVASNGDKVTVVQKGNTWHKIRLEKDGVTGWIYGRYLTLTAAPDTGEWGSGKAEASKKDTATILNLSGTVASSDGYANLRWGPDTKAYGVIAKVNNNTGLWVLEKEGNWYRVMTGNGQIGYMYKTLVKTGSTYTGAKGKSAVIRSSDGFANLRAGAGMDKSVLTSLNNGTYVVPSDLSGNWYAVRKPNGWNSEGYVYRTLVRFLSSALTTGNVNLRSGPATSYDKVRTLGKGESVRLLASNGSFCRVDTGKDVAYVSAKYLNF